MLKN
ncbi:uncharacterized protein FFM5_15361 [Fusarium fujikuroi]|jgi:uncharacterized protein YjbI with pentapeptide repeats